MTAPDNPITLLSRALDQVGDLLVHVHDEQLDDPTPCPEWDVAHLVGHLVGGVRQLTVAAAGGQPDWTQRPEPVPGDRVAAFRSAADDLLHAWHRAGDSASPAGIDMATAELAVHGWDLARATRASTDLLDADVAERALAFVTAGLTEDNRGAAFGPAVPVPDDAPAPDRLAAFAGRDPSR